MTTPISSEIFSPALEPGETIEWAGSPNPALIFHPEDWAQVPFSLLWGWATIYWLLTVTGIRSGEILRHNEGRSGLLWSFLFVLAGQYLIWGRFIHDRWRKRRTWYALTNRRALIVRDGLRGRRASGACFDELPMIDQWIRPDGIGRVSFGGPVQGIFRSGMHAPRRLPTFDDVDDAYSVYQLATRLHAACVRR